ncbi:SDR family NAD(P)-dependent oxidoreductase [Paucimonas lemoignei]|uniref:SDR family NAD(P)-dependent oxidoreductase n=1 Tax=Paucimonas lemoignei TaxID=29443 RepID=UPI001FB4CAEE|nr:SDR family NAD(P)-dependent oxidoreductase [Paucimonas lemoignei]
MAPQRVLITAGASGIGLEIARAFAANGADVCVCDINAEALKTAAQDISGLKTIVCDISKRQVASSSCRRSAGASAIRIAARTGPVQHPLQCCCSGCGRR